MGGVKLLSYLQKNREWSKIPFIIVTAHAHDELGREDLIKLKAEKVIVGPRSYIEKPVIPSEYVNKIREVLGLERIENAGTEALKAKVSDKLKIATKDKLQEALKVLGE